MNDKKELEVKGASDKLEFGIALKVSVVRT